MRADKIDIGESYAFAEGTADIDLIERRVTKVEVLHAPKHGHVEVRLLEDGKTRVCTPYDQPAPVAGDIRKVKTRQLSMPWSRFETRLKNLADRQAEKDKEKKRKDERLRRIQQRLDRTVPMQTPRDRSLAELNYHDEERVTLPTDQLERLLGAAESD